MVPSSFSVYLGAGHINRLYFLKKIAGHDISILQDQLHLSTSNSFVMATVDLSHVQFWQLPLNPTSSKRIASPHIRKNGRFGSTTSSHDQAASLDKADEVLKRNNQAKSTEAAAQYQGRGFAPQQEGDVVGPQGTIRRGFRRWAWLI